MSNKNPDYVPSNAAQFGAFIANIVRYAGERAQGPAPAWPHIPPERFETLAESARAFREALTASEADTGHASIHRRQEAQAAADKILRAFVNQFLRFPPVSDADRIAMGVPNRDAVRTSHAAVTENADFVIRLNVIRELVVDFWVKGAAGKAKPPHYDGAVIIWGLRDGAPQSPEDLPHHALASRTPFTLRFEEADRGKRAWAACCWQNERGITGAWSEFKDAIVP